MMPTHNSKLGQIAWGLEVARWKVGWSGGGNGSGRGCGGREFKPKCLNLSMLFSKSLYFFSRGVGEMRLKWLLYRPNAISALGESVDSSFCSAQAWSVCPIPKHKSHIHLHCLPPLWVFTTVIVFFFMKTKLLLCYATYSRTCSVMQKSCAWLSAYSSILHAKATTHYIVYLVCWSTFSQSAVFMSLVAYCFIKHPSSISCAVVLRSLSMWCKGFDL